MPQNPTLMDGAMGTMLQARGLPKGQASAVWNITNPVAVKKVHEEYIKAGSQIIFSNTFYGSLEEIKAGILLAEECVKTHTHILLGGSLTEQENLEEKIKILSSHTIDYLVLETLTNLKGIRKGVESAHKMAPTLPLMVLMTLNEKGQLASGEPWELAVDELNQAKTAVVGFNCSFGPDHLYPHFLELKRRTKKLVAIKPNTGSITPHSFSDWIKKYIDAGVDFIGGCCGTTPEDIQACRFLIK